MWQSQAPAGAVSFGGSVPLEFGTACCTSIVAPCRYVAPSRLLVPVHRVVDVTIEKAAIEREMALVKVAGTGEKRVEAMRVSQVFRAKALDTTHSSFVFEITGTPSKIDAYVELMRPLGLVEVSRTGVAAISRGAEAM